MNTQSLSLSRRAMLRATGALVVTVSLPASAVTQGPTKPQLLPTELDSWIAVGADGRVTALQFATETGDDQRDRALGHRLAFVEIQARRTFEQGGEVLAQQPRHHAIGRHGIDHRWHHTVIG